MPYSREEHISYTRNELENYDYYLKVLSYLNDSKIKSYIDIGANIGEFCNVMFEKIPSLTDAYLFEVEFNNFQFMKNHVKNKNVNMFNFGIGYNFKNPNLILGPNPGGYFVKDNIEERNIITLDGKKFVVKDDNKKNTISNIVMKTLEELNLPIVDFVKIDIEGGEYNIIENSIYLQNINLIEIEFHDFDKNFLIEKYINKTFNSHEIIILEDRKGRVLIKK